VAAPAQKELTAVLGRSLGAAWENLAFWRALGVGASLALIVVMALFVPRPLRSPLATSYLAVLSEPRSQKPVLVVSAARNDKQLWVTTLEPAIHAEGTSLELWALPKGRSPRSLGVVANGEKTMLPLGAVAEHALRDVTILAVSAEPKGGSRSGAPTGPVLYSGLCVKYW
jgi:anti-sigma-K factor RskA